MPGRTMDFQALLIDVGLAGASTMETFLRAESLRPSYDDTQRSSENRVRECNQL